MAAPKPINKVYTDEYFSDLHDHVVAKVMEELDKLKLPEDMDHKKAMAVILLDMAGLWAVRTGNCNGDYFAEMALASYEEAALHDGEPSKTETARANKHLLN